MTSAEGEVVVGIAGDSVEAYRAALVWGAAEARQHGRPLHLVHGVKPASMVVEPQPDAVESRLRLGRRVLENATHLLESLVGNEVVVRATNSSRPAVEALVTAAEDASVIVLQRRHRTAWEHVTSASVTEAVAARASCPVVVVQTDPTEATEGTRQRGLPVAVGIDPEGRATRALVTAAEEATWRGVALTAVLAWEIPMDSPYVRPDADELELHRSRAERELAEAVAGLHDRYPDLLVHRSVIRAAAGEGLVTASENAQLLVVARHMTSTMTWRALGATTRAVLRHSHCPVCVTNDDTAVQRRHPERDAALWPS